MADNTIIQQGSFTGTGNAVTIQIRSDFDWIRVLNVTEATAQLMNHGYEYYWQSGMLQGQGISYYHPAADHTSAVNALANGTGFYKFSLPATTGTGNLLGSPIAVTAGTNATRPVYSTGDTSGIVPGSIVRVVSTDQSDVNGLDFSIDTIVANMSFRLANTLANAPGIVAGANGFYRAVAPNAATYNLFYPSSRVIANIARGATTTITTLVDHGYINGQQVRLIVPPICGIIEANTLTGTVTVVNASSFTLDIDSGLFTAFTFPLATATPCTFAQVIPVGETPTQAGLLDDSVVNQGFIGVYLPGGILSPGGSNGDVIFWTAGKSFNV